MDRMEDRQETHMTTYTCKITDLTTRKELEVTIEAIDYTTARTIADRIEDNPCEMPIEVVAVICPETKELWYHR